MPIYCYYIYGRVQGVGFRCFTLREATKLAIRGYVRNVNEKDAAYVKCVAQASLEKLELLEAKLRQGPIDAKVELIVQKELRNKSEASLPQGVAFEIRSS